MTQYFITGTGTNIGKTAIICAIIRQLIKEGHSITVKKPIISGWDDNNSDTHEILNSLGLPITNENINLTSPWRFKAPLSPDIAASHEGLKVDFNELVKFCQPTNSQYFLIEGAGGLMTPINNNKTMLDLITALQIPTILIGGTYLGSTSHTLTALKTLQLAKIKPAKLIINQSKDCAGAEDIIKTLKNFTDLKIDFVPYANDGDIKLLATGY